MSDVNENNDVDNTEEEDSETIEAAADFDLRSIGVEPNTDSIDSLIKVYNENHSIVKNYTDGLKKGTSDPNSVDTVVKSNLKRVVSDSTNETVGKVRTFAETVSAKVFDNSYNLLTSEVMLSELEYLVSLMRDERDYHLNAAIQSEKDKQGIKFTPSESATTAKLACEKLRTLIEARVQIAKLTGDPIPENLLKTEGVRKGFNTNVLPRAPRLKLEGTGYVATHLSFKWKSADDPSGNVVPCHETTLNDVAHNVISKGSYRVTGKTIAGMLKKEGHVMGATDTEWSLEFKTGTLYGKKA